jgi:hypothetical protein
VIGELFSSLYKDSDLGYFFGAPIGTPEAVGANFPNSVAIETTVVDKIPLLEALGIAVGTNTTFVQPITVSIKAILDVVFVDFDG